jgi:Secretion system C-terminal sorting domain
MKNQFIYLFLLLGVSVTFSQSWQWGKRGGSIDELYVNYTTGIRAEEAYSIVTDSQKNIYMLSRVGGSTLNFDGVPDTIYETTSSIGDIALISFACDGIFRWSKIIGGSGYEEFVNLQIDSQDNIYLAGMFGNYSIVGSGQQYIDEDVIIPSIPADYRTLVILKYNSAGVLQWYQRPEPNVDGTSLRSFPRGIQIDASGNLYWLVYLGAVGTYADGALTITDITKPWHVLKYSSSGNFLSATTLNLQTTDETIAVQFFRNPYNQNYFVTARTVSTNGSVWATVGSEDVTHGLFLACFDPTGQAIWKRENNSNTVNILIYNLLFDGNDIILGGSVSGINSASFIGFTYSAPMIPGYVMKIDENATGPIWSTYHSKGASSLGAITINGDEVGFTNFCTGTDFTWGTQTLNATSTNQGTEVLFARLNKNTGECLSLTKIPGNIGFDDYGCALAVDASGDYILGGNFSGTLTFDGGVQVTNNGGQSDFFIAKYATQACSPLGVAQNEFENLTQYPNPTTGILNIDSKDSLKYELYDLKGSLVAKGELTPANASIDLSGFEAGTYVLKMNNDNGEIRNVTVVKR